MGRQHELRRVMRRGRIAGGLLALSAALASFGAEAPMAAVGGGAERPPPPSDRVYEAVLPEFTREAYAGAVEALIGAFEQRAGRALRPGPRGRAALKVYTDSGAGLATRPDLVRGVIAALERRGFARESLFLVGLNAGNLRASGFLPPLSVGGATFEGVPVVVLDSGRYYDAAWFYDSPLPAHLDSPLRSSEEVRSAAEALLAEVDRKSMLPVPLMFHADFWINLPGCSDHPVLGVNGALANGTLWAASNTQRFFRSPATGPAAVAEIAAIPELRATYAFTILSLERYQFIGGPVFNSLYTVSEPRVWLSDNTVLLDALMHERIDLGRQLAGFRALSDDLRLLIYATQLDLGTGDRARVEWEHVRLP